MAIAELQYFTVSEVLGNLISNNVEDIDKNRKGNRFVYPELPKDDTNLPEIVVEVGDVSYTPDSAGNILFSETLANGDFQEVYYKKALYNIHIYTITGKEQEFNVEDNGRKLFLTNKPLNIYLATKVIHVLRTRRPELLKFFDNFNATSLSPVFENNKNQWASDITCEVIAKDVWKREYHEGEIIKDYSLSVNLIT